jgi:hypothetical protein
MSRNYLRTIGDGLTLGDASIEYLKSRMGEYHFTQRILREAETYRDPFRRRQIEEILPLAPAWSMSGSIAPRKL